ncbi:MAG: TonB-dependent receptor, partial [Pseudomonadales bacterium]|nr:TonB-dependent receptor [Pseudomonadales bacterium]
MIPSHSLHRIIVTHHEVIFSLVMIMIKTKRPANAVVFSIGAAIGGASSVAHSAALEEIIITATKTSASLQDVPVAVQAFTSDDIQEAGINDAYDVATHTPSLTVTSNSSPFNTKLSVRGIGTVQNDPALEPSVGMFVDGVFLGRSGLGTSDLTDIERIEVLQGPQGTLYGKNTNAGLISVITKKPNLEEFEGYVEISTGNYDMRKLTLTDSGPLSDTVAYRLSGNIHQRDGFYENAAGPDQNDANDWNVQGKLMWEPSDRLTVLLSVSRLERDTKCCVADSIQDEKAQELLELRGLPRDENDPFDYKIAIDRDSSFEMESDLFSLKIDYDLDWGTVTSITAWNDYEYVTATDGDRSQLDVIYREGEFAAGNSLSQELEWASSVGDTIDYQLGLFYYQQETQRGDGRDCTRAVPCPDGFSFLGEDYVEVTEAVGLVNFFGQAIGASGVAGDYLYGRNIWDSTTFAVFGQATWHAGERLHLTGGLRWTEEEREAELFTDSYSFSPNGDINRTLADAGVPQFDPNGNPIWLFVLFDNIAQPIDATLDRTAENVDWMLKAAYDIGDESMVYISASTGTKSGNFNGVNGRAEQREFDDELTLSYELGLKSTLFDNALRINAAAFLTEIEDYQTQQSAANQGGIGSVVVNAAEAEASGIDLQINARPLENLTLNAGVLYLYKAESTREDGTVRRLNHAADFSYNLGATLGF